MGTLENNTTLKDMINGNSLQSGGPAVDWLPVTPVDPTVPAAPNDVPFQIGIPCRALRANVAGVIRVSTAVSSQLPTPVTRDMNFLAGETRYGIFTRVWATGTTATGIEAGT